MEEKANLERPEAAAGLSRYERVKLARHQERPFTIDYISDLFTEFIDPAEGDAILFTSSSTVQNLFDVLGPDAADRLNALELFSIGPITTRTADRLGLRVAATSPEQTIESLVATVRAYYATPGDGDA